MQVESRLIRIMRDGNVYKKQELLKHFSSEKELNKTINNFKSYGLNFIQEGNHYQLENSLELLSESNIYSHLSELGCAHNIYISVKDILRSTSREFNPSDIEAKQIQVSLAEYQTSGRGRQNRTWISPFASGICLSVYQQVTYGNFPVGLSVFIGIELIKCLKKLRFRRLRIKWPNDIYVKERKLGGLLVELHQTNSQTLVANVGLGINYKLPETNSWGGNLEINPIDISEIQESTYISRNLLAAHCINSITNSLLSFNVDSLKNTQSDWRDLDMLFNKELTIKVGKKIIKGINKGIDGEGRLILETNGVVKTVVSGHIIG
uniref:biotin--[biotin carboxyl-carrier protein] ligase n=1 Tax=uncultured gamma proteobacterium HF0500_05P21 TaxID=723572 RepID=E7C4T4_9GAMM|nr:biotin-(acetyl-CoA carboxylase) ligase [uncultured gamma proteobacterium HF0500_05P21]